MPVTFQAPKVFSAIDMFAFWAENLKKEKPHLILKRMSGKYTDICYEVNKELEYLINKNLELDVKVQELEILDKKNIKAFTSVTNELFQIKKQIVLNRQRIIKLKQKTAVGKKQDKEIVMDYNTFKKIITCFNKKAADSIIQGNLLYLGNNLGYSQIRKIVPVVRKGRIDWKESLEYKKELIAKGLTPKDKEHKEGENWLIYKLDPWYLRWAWVKHYTSTHYMTCKVKNNRVYAFYATNTNSGDSVKEKVPGNKTKLALANQADPLLHTRYFTINRRDFKKEEKLEKIELEAA